MPMEIKEKILHKIDWKLPERSFKEEDQLIKLDHQVFNELRDFVYHRYGIYLSDNKKHLLERRLSKHLQQLKFHSFKEYFTYISQEIHSNEINHLMQAVTVTETRFFRNPALLEAIKKVVMPELLENKRKNAEFHIRILSAGCSSGEEPYSLAMLIDHNFSEELKNFQFKIIGIDINNDALSNARRGVFSEQTVKPIPDPLLQKYLKKSGHVYSIAEIIRQSVNFKNMNILDAEKMRSLGMFDLIFCQNVLIFFNKTAKEKAIRIFQELLKPGGYLFVGPFESLYGIEHPFKLVHFVKAMGYQK